MIMIFLYGSLAVAWNILAGYCGQISLGHAVFFGIGAYTSTLLVARAGVSPWLGMLAGAVLAVIVSQAVGFPVFRLRGHYFAIATIAVGEIVQTLFINWDWAGGARGVFVPIRRPDSFVNFQFNESKAVYYYIALGLLQLRSEEHTSELQSPCNIVCRLLLEKKKNRRKNHQAPGRESAISVLSRLR